MRKVMQKLFGRGASKPALESPPASIAPANPEADGNAVDQAVVVARRDDELSGFFPAGSTALISGFPIFKEDVVLDVGCGEGHYAAFCGSHGAEIIVADIDPAKVRSAERLVGTTAARAVRGLVTDANPLPLEAEIATRIIATEVLEHVDDPQQFMRELVRVGKAGALYLISVPDRVSEHLQKDMAAPAYFQRPNHIRIFERDEFRELLQSSGLVIEHEIPYGFYWSLWWVFFWVCKQELAPPWHPLLESWTKTWGLFLATPQGPQFKKILDEFLPKSRIVIARKA